MNTLEANIRNTKTKGELNILRSQGNVPGVIYGGEDKNQNISVSKKTLSNLLEKDNFLSNIINLKVDGKDQKLQREVIIFFVSKVWFLRCYTVVKKKMNS